MTYDFTTNVNRLAQGSAKWQQMMALSPDIPADTVPLSVADTDFRHPPELIDELKSYLDSMVLGYTQPTISYYEAVTNWFARRHQWQVEKEWLLLSPGVVAALYHGVKAYTKPGEGVLILSPVYYPFRRAIENSGRRVVASSLIDTGGYYSIDFTDLEAKARLSRNKLLLFCSPHNPVGRVWTREELQAVDRICRKHDVIVISDEIHFDLIMPGIRHKVFSSLSPAAAANSVILTAPSKSFNLAGLQTANVVIADLNLRQAYQAQQASEGFQLLNVIGPKACELVYDTCEPWLEQFLNQVAVNRRFFHHFMSEHLPMITVSPMEGTYLQWFNCQELGMTDAELNTFLIHECHLVLDPGHLFGEEGQHYQRMSLACPTQVLTESLERLAKKIKELNR